MEQIPGIIDVNDNTSRPKLKELELPWYKKRVVVSPVFYVVLFLCLVVLLIGVIIFFHFIVDFDQPPQSALSTQPDTHAVSTSEKDENVNLEFERIDFVSSSGKQGLSVDYVEPQSTYNPYIFKASDDYEYRFDFFKVGIIIDGEYEGYDFVLADISSNNRGKNFDRSRPMFVRYLVNKEEVVFLPTISRVSLLPISWVGEDGVMLKDVNPFENDGLVLSIRDDLTIAELEYPDNLIEFQYDDQTRSRLSYSFEEIGVLNSSMLEPFVANSFFGQIYSTKRDQSLYRPFFVDITDDNFDSVPTIESVGRCEGDECFRSNGFFAFRPDGTYIKYMYAPFFDPSRFSRLRLPSSLIRPYESISLQDSYIGQTIGSCNQNPYNDARVLPSDVLDKDLVEFAELANVSEPIFELKDPNHFLLKDLFERYQDDLIPYVSEISGSDEYLTKYDYGDYLETKPILVWKDELGRNIQFINEQFLPPHLCEPIVYLYPEVEQSIEVSLGNNVRLTNSYPEYGEGWSVISTPESEILDLDSGSKHPFLFWEGVSYNLPRNVDGFVVERLNIESFFRQKLHLLGLNSKEINDFIYFWLDDFNDAEYYLISFIDQATIDNLAPLYISPEPDMVIRVLFDYKPLDEPIAVQEQVLKPGSSREGFTVVEWGGLKR